MNSGYVIAPPPPPCPEAVKVTAAETSPPTGSLYDHAAHAILAYVKRPQPWETFGTFDESDVPAIAAIIEGVLGDPNNTPPEEEAR